MSIDYAPGYPVAGCHPSTECIDCETERLLGEQEAALERQAIIEADAEEDTTP